MLGRFLRRLRTHDRPRSLRWRLRHENPLKLTKSQYRSELAAQAAALRSARAAEAVRPLWPHEEARVRGERLRRAHYASLAPELTKDQMAAMLNRELIAEANRAG